MPKLQNFQILITVCVVLLLCNQNICSAWRAYKVVFTSFTHEFNSNLMDVKIEMQNDTAGAALNVVINVLEDIDDISLSYSLGIELDRPGNFAVLLSRKVQLCKFLQQIVDDSILRSIYEDVLKQGSFIKVCPVKKGSVFTLPAYRVDEELLPQFIPEAKFYVDMLLEKSSSEGEGDGVLLLKGRLSGKIDKSIGFTNLQMFSMGG